MVERVVSASIHIRLQESTLENRPICAARSARKVSMSRVLRSSDWVVSPVSFSPGPKYAATESIGTSLLSSGGAADVTFETCKTVANAHAKHTACIRVPCVAAGEMTVFCSMILFTCGS